MGLSNALVLTAALALPPSGDKGAADAPRVLLVGDSLMRVGVGPVLKAVLKDKLDADVVEQAKSATGLARPDVYDWPRELAPVLEGQHFTVAVVYLGTNDCQALHGRDAAEPIAYGTPAWDSAYRQRLRDFAAELCAAVDKVLWLALPPMRSPRFNAKITAMNTLVATEINATACGHVVPIALLSRTRQDHPYAFALIP